MLQGATGYIIIVGIASAMAVVALMIREYLYEPKNFSHYFKNFKPLLASHRGYGKHGPIAENTIPAFTASEKLGFLAHEFDVRKSMDGEIILLHGPRLENTTNGNGRLELKTFAELSTLDAAHYLRNSNGKKTKTVLLPKLSAVLRAVSPKARLNIEIKRDRWDFSHGLEELTLTVVAAEKAQDKVCLSGFHFLTLWRLRKLQTKIPVGLLIEPGITARIKLWIYRLLLLPDNIHLHYSTATKSLMASLQRLGYGLAFWTVNDEAIAQTLFDQGADFVITDNMSLIEKFPNAK